MPADFDVLWGTSTDPDAAAHHVEMLREDKSAAVVPASDFVTYETLAPRDRASLDVRAWWSSLDPRRRTRWIGLISGAAALSVIAASNSKSDPLGTLAGAFAVCLVVGWGALAYWFPFRPALIELPYFRFEAPGLSVPERCPPLEEIAPAALTLPVLVAAEGARRWWLYKGSFYWDDEGYNAEDIRALIEHRLLKKQKRLERAHQVAQAGRLITPVGAREHIPLELRRVVFDRYNGRCAECGSNFNIQYDHIIPVAFGGATTVENLQILCADCNRRKGATLG